jgi:multiple sugar transport system substrate-binding protein
MQARTRRAGRLTRAGLLRAGWGAGLTGTAAGALAACSRSAATPVPAAPAAAPASLVLNTDWVGATPRGKVTDGALAEYKQRNPLVTVRVEPIGDNTVEKLTALIASDSIGDVSLWVHQLVIYFARRSFFTDLRPYLKTFKFSMDDVYYVPEICYYEDKLLAVPFQLNLFDWTYNKTLFNQMGVVPPADNWTWEQFIAAAKRLTLPSKDLWGTEWNISTGNPNNWITPIRANGGTLLNATFTKTTLNEPAAADTIGLILDVMHKEQVAPLRQQAAEKKYSFAAGNYAMSFGVAVGRGLDKQMLDAGGMEWDFFYAPTWPRTGKRAVLANMKPYCVPAARRTNVDQATQLAFFMGGEFVQGLIADVGDTAPTTKKITDSDRFLPSTHRRKIVLDGHAYRLGFGSNFEQYVPWRAAVEPEFFKGWDGLQSAKATADNATAAGDAALAANGVVVAR